MIRTLLLYGLSGFISLGYQVAWFRVFTRWFGSTSLTFATVITAFVGGIAVGALLSERLAGFIQRHLGLTDRFRICGVIELLVAATLVLTATTQFLSGWFWGEFPYELAAGIWAPTPLYQAGQVAVAVTCIFLPCIFMGATFPLLASAFGSAAFQARFPSALYAANTLGACLGILACQFLFLPWIGHAWMLWLLVAANVLLGLYFLNQGNEAAWTGSPATPPSPPQATRPDAPPRAGHANLLILAALGGCAAGALEGDLYRRISFVIELNPGATMPVVSFWAVLAIFVASTIASRLPRLGFLPIRIAFVVALVLSQLTWHFVDPLLDFVEAALAGTTMTPEITLEGGLSHIFPGNFSQLFSFVGILVFVPYLLVSLLFPHICNRLHHQGVHLGVAYGLNTLGFCAGLVAFTLLAPSLNVFFSFKLFPVIFAVITACIFLIAEDRRRQPWLPAAAVGAVALAVFAVPRNFDRSFFRAETELAFRPVEELRSNAATTTFVVRDAELRRLYFGRLSMSSTNHASRVYMQLMGHFPLLAHPQPERALVICFGVGNTAAAIAAHESIRRIDIVDLNGTIFETAPAFAATNGNVAADPRVRLVQDDGRNFLNLTGEKYDLITSEPPPPLAAGVDRLYSREYYASVLEHLTPRGLMSQWLPTHLMPPPVVELAIATFLDAFPHALLITGFGTDYILIGSPQPIELANLEQRLAGMPRVGAQLAELRIDDATELLGRIVQTDAELRKAYGAGPVISDFRNDFEQLLPTPGDRAAITYNPRAVLRYLEPMKLSGYEELEGVLLHLGRLRYRVENFPLESLATVRETEPAGVALADADWRRIAELFKQSLLMEGADDRAQIRRLFEEFLAVAPEQPEVLMSFANFNLTQDDPWAAVPLLERAAEIEPGDPLIQTLSGRALMRTGRSIHALEQFRLALHSRPASVDALRWRAWILAAHPDDQVRRPAEAVVLARRAAELTSYRDMEALTTLAVAHMANGEFSEAIAAGEKAVGQATQEGSPAVAKLQVNLDAYQRHLRIVDQSLAAGMVPAASGNSDSR